jgi:hypothetical protein
VQQALVADDRAASVTIADPGEPSLGTMIALIVLGVVVVGIAYNPPEGKCSPDRTHAYPTASGRPIGSARPSDKATRRGSPASTRAQPRRAGAFKRSSRTALKIRKRSIQGSMPTLGSKLGDGWCT